jgi:hypothetical protein
MVKRLLFLFFILIIFHGTTSGQEHSVHEDEHSAEQTGLRVSAAIGHTYLPKDTQEGKRTVILPSFGLDVEYWITHKWGIGMHNDLELQIFEVAENEETIIERDFPVLITIDVLFRPIRHLSLYAGPGVELERSQNFFVTRLGIEYEIPIGNGWDVFPAIFHDVRKDAYDTYSINLGIAKTFKVPARKKG